MIKRNVMTAWGAILLLSGSATVWAGIIPPATSSAGCSTNTGPSNDGGAFSCAQSNLAGYNYGSVTTLPFVSLTAQAASGAFVGSFTTVVHLDYSFEVIGGNPGDQVPLLISTNLSSLGSADALGFASIAVGTSLSDPSLSVCSDGSCSAGTEFSGTLSAEALSGSINTVSLEIEASAGFGPGDQTASASADPWIFIDPTFAGLADYSIELSDGIGNGLSPVPEPSTWSLLLLAALALLLSRDRRKQRT